MSGNLPFSLENLLFTSSAIQSVWRFPPVNNLRLFLHRLLQTLDTSCVVTADSRSVVSSLVSVPLFSFQKSELSASTSHLISPKMKVSPKPQKVQAQQVERILFSSSVHLLFRSPPSSHYFVPTIHWTCSNHLGADTRRYQRCNGIRNDNPLCGQRKFIS